MGFIHAYSQRRWPGGRVPYTINSEDFPSGSSARQNIIDAVNHWNSHTPIRFVSRNGEDDYVEFRSTSGPDSVSSSFGRSGEGRQTISLTNTGLGTLIHEMGHSICLLHEHKRPDRDNYLIVNTDDNQYNIVTVRGIPISNYTLLRQVLCISAGNVYET